MRLHLGIRGLLLAALLVALPSLAPAAPYKEMDPNDLTPEQKDLLNHAYLVYRMDLLPAINITGDQVVVIRNARQDVNYILSLQRTNEGEAIIQSRRATGPGMVKIVLEKLAPVREALSEEQRQAFKQIMTDQKLQPVKVDASTRQFLLCYTFGPNDRVEKAKAPDGRVLDVVIPEKEDHKLWYTELKTGDELVRLMENPLLDVHPPVGDFLVKRGSASLDAVTKKRLAELLLTGAEQNQSGMDPGYTMQAYSTVAQPEHEKRVFALLEKCSIHHLAGMVAAYAAVAPVKALDYIAKPRTDKNYPIRAIQGLGMAPDGLRLLQSARAKMPDMKWMIDQQVKAVTELQKARAEGRPENPGEAAAIRQLEQAKREADERAASGKKPGDYQGFSDWFADLSSDDKQKINKAGDHYVSSVFAVDLSKVTPQQRSAVFKIALAALTAPKTTLSRDNAGKLLIFSADRGDSDAIAALVKPDNWRAQYPLAALMRVNPDKAQEVLLAIEDEPKPGIGAVRKAADLVPTEAVVVFEQTLPKLKFATTRESYRKFIDELKAQGPKS
ncbi:MAG: hypothetical protein GC164_07465 [Phycisphaera sp.]|nr:hypothetical protein [Phycisphaera sp.]